MAMAMAMAVAVADADEVQFYDELVALAENGQPDVHRLSSRMLHGRIGIALILFVVGVARCGG